VSLDEMLGAIRADDAGDGDLDIADATRLRVMRSLESRARSRHRLVGFATTVGILLVGTVSWALATGQVAALWRPAPEVQIAPPPPSAPPPPRHRRPAIAETPRPSPPPEAPPEAPPPEVARPAPPAPPPPVPPPHPVVVPPHVSARVAAPPPVAVEVLYRKAHQLHFHGGDPVASLAAWDAYLSAEPDGRFSVEARYNRALLLVRLGRYADARAALAPFARGEVTSDGYRQAEAEQLVERLARFE
jgi:hypothetical protein